MTLFKQIALLVSLMFLLLASIIVVNDFSRTGDFLQGQLQTTAQDMATTLGIAISNSSSADDEATLEVLFNSVFDSGYYSSIELVSTNGSVIHQKSQQISVEGIPGWFLRLVPLQPAQGSTQVMKGWTQLGQLRLSLHPGYAYSGLYTTLMTTLKWFAVLFIAAIFILWLLLNYLLRPLQHVKQQADSIHRNQFVQQFKIPKTLELKSVVLAMNQMVSRVQSIFSDQESTLMRYQQLLYNDKLTGLGNRRYMLEQLQQSLSSESSFHGSFGVVKLVNFEHLRERHGYQIPDQMALQMAQLIGQTWDGFKAEKVARLSEDEFAFLIAADEDTVVEFIKNIYTACKQFELFNQYAQEVYLAGGVSALETGQTMGDLLAGIDYCLSQSVSAGPFSIEQKVSSNLDLPKGKMQWRVWLDKVLNSNRLYLVGQIAIDNSQSPVQRELFIRVQNEQGQVIPASAFMPMATGLGMAVEIDKSVFRLISEHISRYQGVPLALNLSASFFERAEAQQEFAQLLLDCQQQNVQLCIEASHHILLQHPGMCRQLSDRIKKQGHQFGIDNLDLGQPLQLLQSAQFNYVKINANTLCGMSTDEVSSGFQALKTLTDTLGILIIAVAVDSQELFDQLNKLGVKAMQGNFLNEAVRIDR